MPKTYDTSEAFAILARRFRAPAATAPPPLVSVAAPGNRDLAARRLLDALDAAASTRLEIGGGDVRSIALLPSGQQAFAFVQAAPIGFTITRAAGGPVIDVRLDFNATDGMFEVVPIAPIPGQPLPPTTPLGALAAAVVAAAP